MPSPIDQLAVEQAALGLAEGDPTTDWLKAQDTRGSGQTWMLVKIVMRAVALFFAIALIVFTSLASDVLTLPYALMSTIWNAAEFITMGVRRDFRRGVTPKAHVGADLVLWIYGGFTFGNNCNSISIRLTRLSQTSPLLGLETGLVGVLFLLHFVLFVRACVEVDRRKRSRRIQKLVLALQERDRHRNAETSPPKGGTSTAGKSEAAVFSHRAPPSSVDSPVGVDPRALNAKYDPEAMKLVHELDVLDAQKVLGNRRDVE